MGTERFEDKIKRQLRDREITPSAGSWDKLSAKLDTPQPKKKPFVLWMGIAASVIGGVLILSLVFNSATLNSPEIVDVPQQEIEADSTSEEVINSANKKMEQIATSEENEVKEESIPSKTKPGDSNIKERCRNKSEAIAVIDNKNLINHQSLAISAEPSANKILTLKLNDALTDVFATVENGSTVTDAEVNKLLSEAAAKISKEQYQTDFAVGKVNPQDLLQDVEFEMDNSFRDKIFEILKEGYSKARTAVANRNY